MAADTPFPPVNSGGLIEAQRILVSPDHIRNMFPPVNSGGLIEAQRNRSAMLRYGKVSAGEFRRPH